MFSARLAVMQPLLAWLADLTDATVVMCMRADGVYFQMLGMARTTMLDVALPRESCTEWQAAPDEQLHKLPLGALKVVAANAGGATTLRIRLPSERHPDHFVVETCLPTGAMMVQARVNALELGEDTWVSTDGQQWWPQLSACMCTQEMRLFVTQARTFGLTAVRIAALDAATLEPPVAGADMPSVLELHSQSTGSSHVSEHRMLFTNAADDAVEPADAAEPDADGKRKRGDTDAARKRLAQARRLPNSVRDLRVFGDPAALQPLSFTVKILDRLLVCASFCPTVDVALIGDADPAAGRNDEQTRMLRMRFNVDADARIRMSAYVAPSIVMEGDE